MNQTLTNGVLDGRFGAFDYVVFICMLLVSTSIGIYFGCFGKNPKSTEEYLLGGRKMKTLPIAISLIASQLSGISIMAIPAEMYTFGTQYWMIIFSMILIVLVINYVFVPVFYNNHISNCYEYLETRFSKEIRQVITFAFVVSIYLVLPVIMFIPSLAFSQVTGVNIHIINTIVSFVCVFYTMLGGIKAVVWTDVIQAGIMVVSLVLVLVLGIIKVGGVAEVWDIAERNGRLIFFNTSFNINDRHTFWNTLFGYFILWSSYVGLNQSCVQRIVSVPTIQDARRALWIFCIGFMIITSLNCMTGIVMYARYADCDLITTKVVEKADKLVPYFVQDIVGHLKGMPGIFISCVFSAALSTMSASMNSLSGIVYEDYVRPLNFFKHTEIKANLVMKAVVIITGIYCIIMGLVVEQFSYILQMVMTIAGVTQGATMGVFCMGMLWPWANKKGAMAGAISSIVVMLWIVIGAQVLMQRGELYYPTLPASIDGCAAVGINVTAIDVPIIRPMLDESFSFYKISFPWYGVIGTAVVFIVGLPVSYITGGEDVKSLGPRLISPIAHWMLPAEAFMTEVPMHNIEKKKMEDVELKNCSDSEYVLKVENIKNGSVNT